MTANIERDLALGRRHHDAGQLDRAEAIYRQILQLEPHAGEALRLLGVLAMQTGRREEAIGLFERAVAASPRDIQARLNLGSAYCSAGRRELGCAMLAEVARLAPADADAHYNLGVALAQLGRFEDAAASYRKTLELDSRHVQAERNLGVALHALGRFAEAQQCFESVCRGEPCQPASYTNLGTVLKDQGRMAAAIECYDRAVQLAPDSAGALCSRGTTLLAMGDLPAGWRDYEHRARCPDYNTLRLDAPRWDGSPLAGRTLLIHCEQGLGDTLQFIRYVALVRQRGQRIVVAAQPSLVPLLAASGVADLVSRNEPLPPFDVHAPLLSLPGIFGTDIYSIPADVPYLAAPANRVATWREELDRYGGFKVGIAWQGQRKFRDDRWRSIPLPCFAPLAGVPGVRLLSLQKGDGSEQLAAAGGRFPVVDLAARLDNEGGAFLDTAAVMKNLDLVVTSDTASAHLAGGLGVNVWVALGFAPDWRWMLHRADSPWYPTMRLFRQPTLGDWPAVFARMAGELARLARQAE